MKLKALLFLAPVLLLLAFTFGEEPVPGRRSELRLSAYAPPVMPHELYEDTPCLDCHRSSEDGIPAIPHQEIPNCLQCHIPQQDIPLFKGNRFIGAPEPARSKRPHTEAPPVMPHRYFMREKCLACHGNDSRPDIIHAPHPDRANCKQCHIEQQETKPFRRNSNSQLIEEITSEVLIALRKAAPCHPDSHSCTQRRKNRIDVLA